MSEQPLPQTDVLAGPYPADPSVLNAPAVGRVSMEAVRPQSEFGRLTGGLSALTKEFTDETSAKDNIEEIERYFTSNGVREAIEEGNYSTAELADFVDVLSGIHKKTGYILTPSLAPANPSALEELYKNKHTNLLWLISSYVNYGVANPDHYYQTVRQTEMIVKGVDGLATEWVSKAQNNPGIHPWLQQELMDDPRFPVACADSQFNQIAEESVGDTMQDQQKIRDAEKALLKVFGVPDHMSKDFRRSLRARTLPRGEEDDASIGGIERNRWIYNVGEYCQNVRALGASEAEILHRMCGVVNLDRYESHLLYNQLRFLDRLTPGHNAKEPPKDITVVLADAFGDFNGSSNDLYKGYDPESTLVFEIHRPDDIARYLGLIKQMGIKPSTLVFDTHGGKGALTYNEGKDTSFVVSYKTKDPRATHIETTGLGRFISEDMQPDSVSGEREILVYACYGAEGLERADPMAEAIIKQTKPEDKAVVKAAEGPIAVDPSMVKGGEVFVRDKRPNFTRRASTYVRRLPPIRRLVGPPKPPRLKDEIAPTVEYRLGTRPGEVIKSRPRRGTLVRRNSYVRRTP